MGDQMFPECRKIYLWWFGKPDGFFPALRCQWFDHRWQTCFDKCCNGGWDWCRRCRTPYGVSLARAETQHPAHRNAPAAIWLYDEKKSKPTVVKPHYTSKAWHIIPVEDGRFHIRCDTSYATSGVMELIFAPADYVKTQTDSKQEAS